jgi:hypothetical protein
VSIRDFILVAELTHIVSLSMLISEVQTAYPLNSNPVESSHPYIWTAVSRRLSTDPTGPPARVVDISGVAHQFYGPRMVSRGA